MTKVCKNCNTELLTMDIDLGHGFVERDYDALVCPVCGDTKIVWKEKEDDN